MRLILRKQPRRAAKRRNYCGRNVFFNIRQQLETYFVARPERIEIRIVRHKFAARFADERLYIHAAHVKERPDYPSSHAAHSRQPLQPAATHKMHKHTFRLIVHMMRNGNKIRPALAARTLQKGIAHIARRLFERLSALQSISRDIVSVSKYLYAKLNAKRFHKLFISVRSRSAYMMVKMRGTDGYIQPAAQRNKRIHERDGIRPSGESDNYRRAADAVAFNKVPHGFQNNAFSHTLSINLCTPFDKPKADAYN